MNGFDLIVLVLIGLAAKCGFKRGLAAEFYRLFRIVVALFAGTGLYRLFSGAISDLLNIDSGYADPILFVLSVFGTWALLRRMRRWMEASILAIVPKKAQATGGAIAAACKTGVMLVAIITTVSLSTWLPGRDWIAEDSFTGNVIQKFLPET